MNNKLKIVLRLLISFCLIYLLFFFMFYPRIKLNNKDISIELNSNYKEGNYKSNNLFLNTTDRVIIKNNIDYSKVGEYEVIYKVKYLFFENKIKRKVRVVDKTKPIITLKGNIDSVVCPNKEYIEEGYTAEDNYDKDITDKVKINKYIDRIEYRVSDSSNNEYKTIRNIKYEDKTKPNITLEGDNSLLLYVGNEYKEKGYKAEDNCDGDITSSVVVEGVVDTSSVGEYTVTYTVKDVNGNETSVAREVKVIRRVTSGNGNGVIYLTFDDGPSESITPQILDILKEENVKVTFFVIGYSSSLDYLIKRAYDEGHTIALHSASHNYANIYSSVDNYFNDLNAISNRVKNITGVESKIIRFPGGSSNTVSRKYTTGIMSTLTTEVINRGYRYYDWNVGSSDAGGATTSTEVYNNVINGLSHNKTNVVLMHDYSGNYKTLYALRDIINYGKNNGYTFSNITYDTPLVVHNVAN